MVLLNLGATWWIICTVCLYTQEGHLLTFFLLLYYPSRQHHRMSMGHHHYLQYQCFTVICVWSSQTPGLQTLLFRRSGTEAQKATERMWNNRKQFTVAYGVTGLQVTTHQLIPNNCPHKHSRTTLQCNVFYFQSRWSVPVIRCSSLADRLSFVKPQKLQHFISRVWQTFSFLTPTDFKDLDDLRHVADLQRTEEWSPICSTLQQNLKPRASISPCIWHKTLPKKKSSQHHKITPESPTRTVGSD